MSNAGPTRLRRARRHGIWILGGTLPLFSGLADDRDPRPFAAALLYVNKRKDKKKPAQPGPIPSGENPETD